MKRYFSSVYIKKSQVPEEARERVDRDLRLFNRLYHQAFSRKVRRVEDAEGRSPHVAMKETYHTNDYFITAVEGAVKQTARSQKELLQMYADNLREDLQDIQDKEGKLTERRENLIRMKESLVRFTKSGGKDLRMIRNFRYSSISFKPAGSVCVGVGKNAVFYPNVWAFEHQYLEPKVKQLRSAIHNLRGASARKQGKLQALERRAQEGSYSVYFGGRALRDNERMPAPQKEKRIRGKREGQMTLSGRKDAPYGNYMVHYDPNTRELSYRGASSKDDYVRVGRVEFPYGQAALDSRIKASLAVDTERRKREGQPVAWTVVDCGNAYRFDVCVTMETEPYVNYCRLYGCVGLDINADRLAVVETDRDGMPRGRFVLPLDLSGTSGQNRQRISLALEKVFRFCVSRGKPLAAEDIGNVKRKAGRYSKEPKRNRAISLFASACMRELLESKEQKHQTDVQFVDPGYTSQAGKVKYARRFGMSVHESAALCIARRGLEFTEKLPADYRSSLTKKQARSPRMKQWAIVYKETKKVRPYQVYLPLPGAQDPGRKPEEDLPYLPFE